MRVPSSLAIPRLCWWKNGRGNTLWPQVVSVIQEKNYPIEKRDDAGQTLTTDWVNWNRLDEDEHSIADVIKSR
ncbi:lipoprotein [Salmonella bongori]|nr:lipoprotein [Salmonella bongori]